MRPFLTIHSPARARSFYTAGHWRDETLYGLLAARARERPDSVALQDGRSRLTWRELLDRVDGVDADLRARGLVRGDRVAIWLSNRVEAIILFLACSRGGFACNPSLHRSHTPAQIADLTRRISARALLTEALWGADRSERSLEEALAGNPRLETIYYPETFPRPGRAPGEMSADPDQVVYLAFTSGTTGAPKCVMHSDNTLLANARELVRVWGHDHETVMLSLSPLSHHIAWFGVAQWLLAGGRFVTDDPPPGMSRFDWIVETEATYVLGVPTHAIDILAEQQTRGRQRLGAVRIFYMAGSAIPPAVAEQFRAQGITPQNVYGMTENSSHQYTHPDDSGATILRTCGRGGSAYEVRLFDPADRDRPARPGEIGEIGGRGAALMLGYFDDQASTEGSFNADGWFMSGDLGAFDGGGNLRIEGRSKDLIIRGGHNIYPARIEELAIRHPGVAKAACFPVADQRLGERVCIAVIGDVTPWGLLQHLRHEGLSRSEMPEYFVSLDSFPLTASGKVLKRVLTERARDGAICPAFIREESSEEQPHGH